VKYSPLFKQALAECRKRLADQPDFQPLRSIEKQLQYLIDLDEGRADFSLVANLNLGLLAVREFEPHDMAFANLLYEVTDSVEKMRFKR
jgi:hypothetical protein